MMLDTPTYPLLPTVPLDTSTSFSLFPLGSRSKTHQQILHPSSSQPSPASAPSPATGFGGATFQTGNAGPGPSSIAASRAAHQRVVDRALLGKRPWGVGMGREADELDEEEAVMEQDGHNIGMFGHRFLLPFGRRQTQMELDAAPSPSPSQVDDDRRQEDRNEGGMPLSPAPQMQADNGAMEEVDEEGVVDLDASVEDLDASAEEDPDGMEED